ncbi:hypothetical protein COL5a_003219 [Colletotrichum fioriniae]|uniref:uncharacterized protein n=1 Tax=Colletotrichum fioriniae TaxID=710243 RepID=UPI002300F87C|nr:uncharacterized protein COL516b_004323 [Colletotrichum fioriniae]KAJ0307090.1 hypothetical protein COL516b_004323 [Colletotrichum fioriniae]KAJ0330913.1 hypothetical protein COL5a_003219 [Colletotrichum fioriniae]KAJ3945117.1 hypothetical protein N0V96_005141 [Colletotrichum fioriniae]
MAETEVRQWTFVLILTALLLSLVVLSQILTTYITAYRVAPNEITSFIDAVDFSVEENESYDRDVAKVQRLEDKLRLGRLLREIQKGGDDLREEINLLLLSEDTTSLRLSARLLWASKRRDLEERVRRLDLVRMRFLVVYMGVVADRANVTAERQVPVATPTTPQRDPEKTPVSPFTPPMTNLNAHLTRALTEEIRERPPLRRLTTQAIGHREITQPGHKLGWAGVVQELQKSPRMHKRRSSIERSIEQELADSKLTI